MAKRKTPQKLLWVEAGLRYGDRAIRHLDGEASDYTLCGAAPEEGHDGEPMARATYGKINCPDCVRLIRFCKAIPAAWLANV